MIDERHLDELLREAGEELDRLSGDHRVVRGESVAATREHGRRSPILAAAAVIAVGVTGVILVRNDRAAAPGNGSDVEVSAAAPSNGRQTGPTTAPAPVTEPDPFATLPYFMLAPPPPGFELVGSISGANGKDFEPYVHLLGWRDPAAANDDLVPVVVSTRWVDDSLPDSRPVDNGNVTGWIADVGGTTVGSFHVDGMSATVTVYSTAIPDGEVVGLVSGLPPSLEVEWGAGDGPPAAFVEIARQAQDAFIHITNYAAADGGQLSFGTLTDYPLNGLTLEGEPTVSQAVVGGRPGFVLRSTSAGVDSALLYWACGIGYPCVLGFTGGEALPTNAELEALAQRTRPATPAEIEQFEEM